MKVRILPEYSFLFLFIFSFTNCSNNDENIVYKKEYTDEIKDARKDAIAFMATNHIPGGSFAISIEGELIYSEGMGLASKDLDVPVTRITKFRIADVSELFTSLIYWLMVEKDILHPDSTVQSYLSAFPKKNYKIKLENLVHHTSGIREPYGDEVDWRGLNISLQQGIDNFKEDPLVAQPGYDQFTSSFNYNLLGAIMEKATEKHFHEILHEYLTDTLKLENTVIDNPFVTIENRTDFYDHNYIAQVVNATFRDMRYRAPSQGLLSTSEDLVTFGNSILYSNYISEEIKEKLFNPVSLDSGLNTKLANGWMLLENQQGITIYGRSGMVTGGTGVLLLLPEYELVFACAFNLNVNPELIPVFKMINPFLPNETTKNEAGVTE